MLGSATLSARWATAARAVMAALRQPSIADFFPSTKRSVSSSALPAAGQRQRYETLLVLDLEATCDAHKDVLPQEVIEIGVVAVNARTLTTVRAPRQRAPCAVDASALSLRLPWLAHSP